MKNTNVLILIILFIAVTACSNSSATAVSVASPSPGVNPLITPDSDQGYPYPISAVQISPEGYPYPNSAYPQPQLMATSGPVPQPSSDSGVITGILLLKGKPVIDVNVYLADLLKNDQGVESIASFDRTNSLRAFTDNEGRFVFANVKPGKYGLVLDMIVISYLLVYPNGNNTLIIQTEAGKTADLGKLNYSELPIAEQ